MITATRIGWFLLAATLAAMVVFSGSAACLALLAALLLLPLLLLAANLLCRRGITAQISCPVNARKNHRQSVTLRVRNGSWLPLCTVACRLEVKNLLTGAGARVTHRVAVLPGGERSVELQLDSAFCGRIEVRVERLRLYDCFWLIPVTCACAARAAMTVQPETFTQSVRILPNVNSSEDSEVYAQDRPGYDLTEPFQLRDYRQGDSIRQIHWKLTTKFGRLISKDPSQPITRSVLLLWERRQERVSSPEQDAQAEVLVSLCRALLTDGVQFHIGWNERESGLCVLQEVRDMDELIGLLPRLLSATAFTRGPAGAEAFYQTAQARAFSHIVYLTQWLPPAAALLREMGHVTVLQCAQADAPAPEGMEYRRFDTEKYASALLELEI